MPNVAPTELTGRQRSLLRSVVEEHIATGQPVGSKTLVERTGLRVSSSTVRAELAELEALGLLTHPHTSAGRVPTEAAYRYYADGLLERLEPNPGSFPLDLSAAQAEVESALQATTEMLSAVTRLLALVSAPPLESATIRHVEVLLLQPQVVMIVVITSTGAVTKRIYAFAEPVDRGLANWAGQYLNDTVAGLQPGTHQLRQRLEDPTLQRLSLVGAAYGVANRTLGAVSLLGPVRMDYEKALRSVRGAASELSRFVEEIYESN